MTVRTPFEITAKAGAWVAGRFNPGAGNTLQLTEDEAAYPLLLGEIARPAKAPAVKPRRTPGEDAS